MPSSFKKKLKVLLQLVTIVLSLLLIVVALAYSGNETAELFLRIATGDGGILRKVGMVRANCGEITWDYEAYAGKGKCTCGASISQVVLLARETPGIGREGDLFSKILLGRSELRFPGRVNHVKMPFGTLPMSCLGGVSCGKALNEYSLDISCLSGTNRYVLTFPAYPSYTTNIVIEFDVPPEVFNAIPERRPDED